MIQPRYLTEKEVSELTRISLAKLRQDRWKSQGIPYYKIGRAVRYHLKDIDEFMEQHRIEANRIPSRNN